MLEMRLTCENCKKSLPPDSKDAMICNFECTFCKTCVDEILHNVCPNCSGGFQQRPVRPKKYLEKYPPRTDQVYKPINTEKFAPLLERYRDTDPAER